MSQSLAHHSRSASLVGFVLLLALSMLGCDGRDTSVSGPNFVGFGYTRASFEGDWTGTFSIPDFEVFQTVRIEVDSVGDIVDGLDSRRESITSGDFFLDDGATGELHFNFWMSDSTFVQGIGIFEPGGESMVGFFATNQGAAGEFTLARSSGPGAFTVAMMPDLQDLSVVDLDTDDARSGTLEIDENGEVLDTSELDGVAMVGGELRFTDDEKGDLALTLELEDGEVLVLLGVYSLADDKSAGTTTTLFPAANGLFLLQEPVDEGE